MFSLIRAVFSGTKKHNKQQDESAMEPKDIVGERSLVPTVETNEDSAENPEDPQSKTRMGLLGMKVELPGACPGAFLCLLLTSCTCGVSSDDEE